MVKTRFFKTVCIYVFELDKKCLLVFGQNLAIAAIVHCEIIAKKYESTLQTTWKPKTTKILNENL